ncbi:MAG: adenylate kinase [Actinomycetia bacterium]|nr:adenylate kinase [Actinomycetes bacterium]
MIAILLGPPGAGKGTQAQKIAEKFKIPHISTGDILRKEIKTGSQLGNKAREYVETGKLVPDELIIEIIELQISGPEASRGFILDGFPRNLAQARMLENRFKALSLSVDKVINIDVGRQEVISRLTSRGICPDCRQVSTMEEGGQSKCPDCGQKLIKRKDDNVEVIEKRLDVYSQQTEPLINYYRDRDILVDIDGEASLSEVTERILGSL